MWNYQTIKKGIVHSLDYLTGLSRLIPESWIVKHPVYKQGMERSRSEGRRVAKEEYATLKEKIEQEWSTKIQTVNDEYSAQVDTLNERIRSLNES